MNFGEVVEALGKASLFDLYRLSVAINQQLDDPKRGRAVRLALRVGQEVEYFDHSKNRLVAARVIELFRTRVLVRNHDDGEQWRISLYMINLQGVDTQLPDRAIQPGLDRQALSVGDWVGFVDKHGIEHAGKVIKLNPKTAVVRCREVRWRVTYSLLFRVLDPGAPDVGLIECQPE